MNEQVIEKLLRNAPPVRTPAGLLEELQSEIELPRAATPREPRLTHYVLRRWLPALGFALWFLGCIVVLGIQAHQIAELKRAIQQRQMAAAASSLSTAAQTRLRLLAAEVEQLRKDATDVQRLRTEVEQLRARTDEVETLRAQNQQLRVELKSQTPPAPKPEEDFFAQAADRASRIKCVNYLKQVGLAARLWANDSNTDAMPTEIVQMLPYLGGPEGAAKLLHCPADGTTAYVILSPGASESDPNVVFARCPIHNNACLVDGSVQQLGPQGAVVLKNGKWVIGNVAQ
jgi:hypothetical protein